MVGREKKKAVNKYSFHGGGSSALQTPFSKGRICWSTFALQDSWRQYWYGGGDSRVLEKLSLFPSEKRSTTIILPQLTKGKRKQTQSFSRKKNTTLPPLK